MSSMEVVSLDNQINNNDGPKELPLEFSQSMIHSNDLDVLKSVQREVIPRELSSFGSQTASGVVSNDSLSNRLTFYVSDPRHYLDMLNSYFTADFSAVCETNGSVDLASFIDVGGIHSCIKTLTIKIGGTVLMRLDDYNKWYNIMNLGTHSKEYTDFMLAPSLDSQNDYGFDVDYVKELTLTAGTYDATGGATEQLLTLVGSALDTQAEVDDLIKVVGTNAAGAYATYGRIRAIGSATVANVDLGSVDFATITQITILKRRKLSSRSKIMNQATAQKIQWRLPVGCLSFNKYFPLPYIQNIAPLEIEFEFVDARLALCVRDSADAAANNKIGFLVSRPRFITMLKEPSNKVLKMHDSLYNGNGLWFPYINYRHFQNKISANETEVAVNFQTNITSARHLFSVITGQNNDDANTTATQAVKSQSTFYRSSVNYFRAQSGSLQFPDYGNCQVGNYMASEAWAQLMLAFNMKENTLHSSRIEPWEWMDTSGEKFIMGLPLAKDESMFSGVSCKNNFLELLINKSGVNVAYNLHSYVGFDAALVVQKNAGARLFD